MRIHRLLSAAVLGIGALSLTARADVTGKCTFDGKPPERKKLDMKADAKCAALHKEPVLDEKVVVNKDGGLRDAVIVVLNPPKGGAVPAEPAVLDQRSCAYVPHVLGLMVGQKFIVKNSDPFMHNVHSFSENNTPFNFGQPNVDPGKTPPNTPFKKPEEEGFLIKCDVHPWMSAYVYVFDHPYFAVSAEDGTFTLKGLPDGTYDVVARHPVLDEVEGKVTVKDGKGEVSFAFKPLDDDAAEAGRTFKTIPVSVLTEEAKKPCCGDCGGGSGDASGPADKQPAARN